MCIPWLHNAPTVSFTFFMFAPEQDSATHSKNDSTKEKVPHKQPTFVQLLGAAAAAVCAHAMPHAGKPASNIEVTLCALACRHNSACMNTARK